MFLDFSPVLLFSLMTSRILELKAQGLSIRQIAEKVHIAKSTVARILAVPQMSHAVPPTVPKVSQKISGNLSKPAVGTSHAVPSVPPTVPKLSHAAHFLNEFLKQEYGIEDLAADDLQIGAWTGEPIS